MIKEFSKNTDSAIPGLILFALVGTIVLILALWIVLKISQKNRERSTMPDFSVSKSVEKPIKKVEEDEPRSWEEIKEDMEIGILYAKYTDYALSATELDILRDHHWKLCAVDDDAYYFERVAGGLI